MGKIKKEWHEQNIVCVTVQHWMYSASNYLTTRPIRPSPPIPISLNLSLAFFASWGSAATGRRIESVKPGPHLTGHFS